MLFKRSISLLLLLITTFLLCHGLAFAEDAGFDFDNGDWDDAFVILDDPELFMCDEDETYWQGLFAMDEDELEYAAPTIPVISSVGKKNVKLHGVRSNNKLLEYTIPEELLAADPNFLALMIEAEKYIGYPFVYGSSNPKTGFDCSGFVCWTYIHSGVYDTKRRGANGLHDLCTEISADDIRPGDLVFFEHTMGPDVDGITHVGIYVGNQMMIHAGDPVGFADLTSERWKNRLYCYGRLPID